MDVWGSLLFAVLHSQRRPTKARGGGGGQHRAGYCLLKVCVHVVLTKIVFLWEQINCKLLIDSLQQLSPGAFIIIQSLHWASSILKWTTDDIDGQTSTHNDWLPKALPEFCYYKRTQAFPYLDGDQGSEQRPVEDDLRIWGHFHLHMKSVWGELWGVSGQPAMGSWSRRGGVAWLGIVGCRGVFWRTQSWQHGFLHLGHFRHKLDNIMQSSWETHRSGDWGKILQIVTFSYTVHSLMVGFREKRIDTKAVHLHDCLSCSSAFWG